MVEVCVPRQVDADLAASGISLNLVTMGGLSGSTYPKRVKAIMLCDDAAESGATHTRVNVRLTGSRNRIVMRLTCGEMHFLPVKEIFVEHTDVNGLIVFGDE